MRGNEAVRGEGEGGGRGERGREGGEEKERDTRCIDTFLLFYLMSKQKQTKHTVLVDNS